MAEYLNRAKEWLSQSFDQETIDQVKSLMENNPKELEESFYKNLEFGTGGLRGLMGVGTNRINKYTIGMATQGFANYLLKTVVNKERKSLVVGYDNRNGSREFAQIVADIFAANGFQVYLFDKLRPTPQLSFAIREFKAVGGVMITASHNPKEYNGYKVYWSDGAQVTSPHDTNIIEEVERVTNPSMVKFKGEGGEIISIDEEFDEVYLDAILSLTLSKELIVTGRELKIVYTPLHGTGVDVLPKALRKMGFKELYGVPQQEIVDGNFPTVEQPNPEEPEALKLALERGEELNADLVMGTDPDADRLGIAVRDGDGSLSLLNGNQMASLLCYYLLERRRELGKLEEREAERGYMVKTIVTTDLISAICEKYGVKLYNVLTGFKYIAQVVREQEGRELFIAGGEESYGFNIGEYVRDKDAVITAAVIAEAALWAKSKGESLYSLLLNIYKEFGLYKEELLSITREGKEGAKEIEKIMRAFRDNPPLSIDNSPILLTHDYLKGESVDNISDLSYSISLPKSNVLQFITRDNTILSVRPSGTEPKIKFYIGVKSQLNSIDQFKATEAHLSNKIERIIDEIKSR